LRVGAYRAAPFICYEIVYADQVSRAARDTDLIITISNDSWFGKSIGPLQHLQIAKMRALENGRYVLRATNNGVSAIIDHQGRIVKQSEQFVTTTLVGPVNVMLGNTPFGSFGTTPIITGAGITLGLMYLMYLGFWRDTE
jgi:apolipoprotein N-acyltransferase